MVTVVVFEFSVMRCQPLRRALEHMQISLSKTSGEARFRFLRYFVELRMRKHQHL